VPPLAHFDGLSALFSRDHADLSRAVIQVYEASAVGTKETVWPAGLWELFRKDPNARPGRL